MRWVLISLTFLLGSVAVAAPSKREISAICDSSARVAGEARGVPVDVLRALTRTETGRRIGGNLSPWPWTVNMEGAGFWFETREEALDFVMKHHARGARSFDVGCFQINYRWHGEAFESIAAMFDPAANAAYAAKFLSDLHGESGKWSTAAGHYHSRTPELAKKYRGRFATILAGLGPAPDPVPLPPAPAPQLASLGPRPTFGASASGLPPEIGSPRHAANPGGVSLSAFSDGSGLLPQARPLLD